MRQLPLFRRMIFVDWHGVLSGDPFWISILQNPNHPLRSQLEQKLADIFSDPSTTLDWMRGAISSEQIISQMSVWMDRRFHRDFLVRRLDHDCTRMRVNGDLFDMLRKLTPVVPIILATDNMDCFFRAFERAKASKRRPRDCVEALAFLDWVQLCDGVLCSSELRVLKAEDPVNFFGPLLSEYNLGFPDAVLIDDRDDNCRAFKDQGGTAIQWKIGKNDIEEVRGSLLDWLGWPSEQKRPATSLVLQPGNDVPDRAPDLFELLERGDRTTS